MRAFLVWVFKAWGWQVKGTIPVNLKKYIIIVGPHTSNWDFVVGVLARAYLKLGFVRYLGKKELFRWPYGWLFRLLGGYPVDRKNPENIVDGVVKIFDSKESFVIALAPEGTRRKVKKLRTGFWYIAKKAKIPIVQIGMEYGLKRIIIKEPLNPGNLESDMENIIKFYLGIKGRRPGMGFSKELV